MEFKNVQLNDLGKVARAILDSTDGRIYLFSGEMGAGKTTLIKAFCRELKCEDEVSSPTFSLVNHYVSPSKGDVFHFDLYRLNTLEEAMDIGFEEYLDSGAFCLIEWPEIILKLISEPYVNIEVISNPTGRSILTYHEPI